VGSQPGPLGCSSSRWTRRVAAEDAALEYFQNRATAGDDAPMLPRKGWGPVLAASRPFPLPPLHLLQHPEQHGSERAVLLAVDQQLGEGASRASDFRACLGVLASAWR
jgi:hypothetical protein